MTLPYGIGSIAIVPSDLWVIADLPVIFYGDMGVSDF